MQTATQTFQKRSVLTKKEAVRLVVYATVFTFPKEIPIQHPAL